MYLFSFIVGMVGWYSCVCRSFTVIVYFVLVYVYSEGV